ncbi:MAG: TM2 domain-containing protein [Oscillospiraceae bacterium]|jgi:restriction system protein|nr:TM2 domain-containing protein [Oscillospiraceae bacterium]
MFCNKCGKEIDDAAAVCVHCGVPTANMQQQQTQQQPQIVINNANTNTNVAGGIPGLNAKNKWVAWCLCLFLGGLGAHKFYEGKTGMGILYLFTGGLFCIGWLIDIISLLFKPNPYYVA